MGRNPQRPAFTTLGDDCWAACARELTTPAPLDCHKLAAEALHPAKTGAACRLRQAGHARKVGQGRTPSEPLTSTHGEPN
eukprot:scaffold50388_cov33-Tisochrysis_lutea.AAC.2